LKDQEKKAKAKEEGEGLSASGIERKLASGIKGIAKPTKPTTSQPVGTTGTTPGGSAEE
jgi:hypothetical protein